MVYMVWSGWAEGTTIESLAQADLEEELDHDLATIVGPSCLECVLKFGRLSCSLVGME